MNAVTIEIPEAFTTAFGATPEEVGRNAKIALAVEMYREGKWSSGRGAQFAGLYIGDFLDVLRDRKLAREYTEQMLEQDLAYARGGV